MTFDQFEVPSPASTEPINLVDTLQPADYLAARTTTNTTQPLDHFPIVTWAVEDGDSRSAEDGRERETPVRDPDRRPTTSEDLATLRDPESRVREVEDAGRRLVRGITGSSDRSTEVIRGLRNIAESSDATNRERREARELLIEGLERLYDPENRMNASEVRERAAMMGRTVVPALGAIVAANPVGRDRENPSGRAIRDNANLTLGLIHGEESTHQIWQAFSEVKPERAAQVLGLMVRSGTDMRDIQGLGTITALRSFAEEWRPGVNKRVASERALAEMAQGLVREPNNLLSPDVRERLSAIGPSAAATLQRIVDANPATNDGTNAAGRRLRVQAENLLRDIGVDHVNRTINTIREAGSENRPHQVTEATDELIRNASDTSSPLAPHLVRALNEEYQQWRPGTAQQRRAENMLQQVTQNLVRDPSRLTNPQVEAMVRAAGPVAIPTLERITTGPGAEQARRLIENIRLDERNRRASQPTR